MTLNKLEEDNIMNKEVINDENMVAYCGLYCAACGKFQKGSCPGCVKNEKAAWCKIRTCCIENGYKSCADCKEFSNVMDCKKYNNFISKVFGFVFRSNRAACIAMIKEGDYKKYADYMTEHKMQSMRR